MARVYIDNLGELTGTPGTSSGTNTSWENAINLNTPSGQTNDRGDYLTLGEIGAYSWQATSSGQSVEYVTSYGLKIRWYCTTYNSNGNCHSGIVITDVDTGNQIGGFGGLIYKGTLRFAIDDDLQEAYAIIIASFNNNPWFTVAYNYTSNPSKLYQILKRGIIPAYTWTPVSSISGKNGILSLSTLTDINDGNPVSTSDTTKFTLQEVSNIKTLVGGDAAPNVSASGGGAAGSDPQYGGQAVTGKSGTQSMGYAFGQGEAPGGGGGFYGGYGGEANVSPAGAGSGYIGNSLLSNKKMYGYGVAKNTSESAYTISKSNHSVAAIEKKPKAGNGYARITYLRPLDNPTPPSQDWTLFNLNLLDSPYRDVMRYDSSTSVTVIYDSSYSDEHSNVIQGTFFEAYDQPYLVSDGILTSNDTEYEATERIIWAYDYTQSANIIPATCTFFIDMEVYAVDSYDDFYLDFCKHAIDEYDYDVIQKVMNFKFGRYAGVGIDEYEGTWEYFVENPLQLSDNTWYSVQYKCEVANGYLTKIDLIVDGTTISSIDVDNWEFVCINSPNSSPVYTISLTMEYGTKLRKLRIGSSIA